MAARTVAVLFLAASHVQSAVVPAVQALKEDPLDDDNSTTKGAVTESIVRATKREEWVSDASASHRRIEDVKDDTKLGPYDGYEPKKKDVRKRWTSTYKKGDRNGENCPNYQYEVRMRCDARRDGCRSDKACSCRGAFGWEEDPDVPNMCRFCGTYKYSLSAGSYGRSWYGVYEAPKCKYAYELPRLATFDPGVCCSYWTDSQGRLRPLRSWQGTTSSCDSSTGSCNNEYFGASSKDGEYSMKCLDKDTLMFAEDNKNGHWFKCSNYYQTSEPGGIGTARGRCSGWHGFCDAGQYCHKSWAFNGCSNWSPL